MATRQPRTQTASIPTTHTPTTRKAMGLIIRPRRKAIPTARLGMAARMARAAPRCTRSPRLRSLSSSASRSRGPLPSCAFPVRRTSHRWPARGIIPITKPNHAIGSSRPECALVRRTAVSPPLPSPESNPKRAHSCAVVSAPSLAPCRWNTRGLFTRRPCPMNADPLNAGNNVTVKSRAAGAVVLRAHESGDRRPR